MRVVRPGTLLLSPARGCFQSELLLFKPVGRFGKLTLFFFLRVSPVSPGITLRTPLVCIRPAGKSLRSRHRAEHHVSRRNEAKQRFLEEKTLFFFYIYSLQYEILRACTKFSFFFYANLFRKKILFFFF